MDDLEKLRAQAEEALGRPLSPTNSPDFLKDLRELSARDPELARQLLRAVRTAQAGKDPKSPSVAEAERVARQAASAMRSSERFSRVRESFRHLRDRFFLRTASVAGKRMKVPRKPMILLALLLLVLAGGYALLGMMGSPSKKPQAVVNLPQERGEDYAQADYETVAARAEEVLGRPLPPPGTEEFDEAVAELQRKDPDLARAVREKGDYQAALSGMKKTVEDVAQGKQDLTAGTGMEALASVPAGPPASQGDQEGQGQTAVPPPPPVPPPPTAPAQGAAPSPGGQLVGPFDLAVASPTRPSFLERGDQAQGQGAAQGQTEGARPAGFLMIEANRKPPEVVAQEAPQGKEAKGGFYVVDRSGGSPSPLVVDRSGGGPSGPMGLMVVDAPGDRQGPPGAQGFVVLAERSQVPQPAAPPGNGVPPGIGPYDILPPPPGTQPGAQAGSSQLSPRAGALGEAPRPAQSVSGQLPSQAQASAAALPASSVSGAPPSTASGSPPSPARTQGQQDQTASPSPSGPVAGQAASSSGRLAPGRFYTARLNVKVVVVEGGTSPALLEGADGTIWAGTASLNPLGRVEINLDTAYLPSGETVRVKAVVYDQDRQLGLQASVREEAPSLAQDLLRASASAFGQYVEYLSKQTSVVQLPGGGVAQTQQAPPLEYVLLGQVGKLFQLPEERKSLVRIGEVLPGKVVQVLVLGGP